MYACMCCLDKVKNSIIDALVNPPKNVQILLYTSEMYIFTMGDDADFYIMWHLWICVCLMWLLLYVIYILCNGCFHCLNLMFHYYKNGLINWFFHLKFQCSLCRQLQFQNCYIYRIVRKQAVDWGFKNTSHTSSKPSEGCVPICNWMTSVAWVFGVLLLGYEIMW